MTGKVIIFSAPSGSGKSTIVAALLERFSNLEFSISATSRSLRGTEQDGKEYYFLTEEEFCERIKSGKFIEWEEVYTGTRYGTLKSELERIWSRNHTIVFDIDVKGGINLKEKFGSQALSLFIMPPSVKELERRLQNRGTDSPETIRNRIERAELEIGFADRYDRIIVNDDLQQAISEAEKAIKEFLND